MKPSGRFSPKNLVKICLCTILVICMLLAVHPLHTLKEENKNISPEIFQNRVVYYGVISYWEGTDDQLLVVIPGHGEMGIPKAEKIPPYLETDFSGLKPGDLVRIIFPEGVRPMIMETAPAFFSESAESIEVMGRGSFALEQVFYDQCQLAIPLNLAPEVEKGDILEIYHGKDELVTAAAVLSVDEQEQSFRVELSTENATTFLSEFGFGIQLRRIRHVPSKEEMVQESGNALLSKNVDLLTSKQLQTDSAADGAWLIYMKEISRNPMGIRHYIVDSPMEDNDNELPFLEFADSCAFLVNKEMNSVRYEAISFEQFADIAESGATYQNVPCTITFQDHQIVQAVMDSSWYDTGITYEPFIRDTWYKDVQTALGMGISEILDTYYTLADTKHADIGEGQGTETIEIYTGNTGDGDSGIVLFKNKAGELLYSESVHTSRTGRNAIYLGEMNGTDFVMTVHIEDRDQYGEYRYQVFRLGAYGQILQIAGSSFTFGNDRFAYDEEVFKEWMDDMNGYLNQSHLLLSTQDGVIRTEHVSETDK